MGKSQKGTALCIKQLIIITLFFHKICKILLLENYLILFRTYFCNTFHFLSEFWSKIFSSILLILVIHPKGCDKATPIFCFSVVVGKWLNIFAWFFLHRVCNDLNYFLKTFKAYQITTWGVVGPRQFLLIIVGALEMFDISWFRFHRVDNHPTYILNTLIMHVGPLKSVAQS